MNQQHTLPENVPCRRFDQAGITDPRLLKALALFSKETGVEPAQVLLDLYDHNDRLWATWRDDACRTAYAPQLTSAWEHSGGPIEAIHLLNVDEDIEFDDDDLGPIEPN